jgi:hypothetical protein
MVTLEHFYGLLKEAARSCPPLGSGHCLQLQAFRALAFDTGNELNSDNLGATVCDQDRPYFWSRRWENSNYHADQIRFDWPVLLVYEKSAVRHSPFGRAKVETWLEIGVVDAMPDGIASGVCDGCEGRTVHDVFRDTQRLLTWVLEYLSKSKLVEVVTADGNTHKTLSNPVTLDRAIEVNRISSYTVLHEFGAVLGAVDSVEQFRVDYPAKRAYGTAVVPKITFFDCPQGCISYDIPGITLPSTCC